MGTRAVGGVAEQQPAVIVVKGELVGQGFTREVTAGVDTFASVAVLDSKRPRVERHDDTIAGDWQRADKTIWGACNIRSRGPLSALNRNGGIQKQFGEESPAHWHGICHAQFAS